MAGAGRQKLNETQKDLGRTLMSRALNGMKNGATKMRGEDLVAMVRLGADLERRSTEEMNLSLAERMKQGCFLDGLMEG